MSKKISQLSVATLTETDQIPVVPVGGNTLKTTAGELLTTRHPSTTRWESLQVNSLMQNSSKPDFDYTNVGFVFDPDTNETLYASVKMPHAWKEGTAIKPHVRWMTSASGAVIWQFEYKWTSPGDLASSGFATTTPGVAMFTWGSGIIYNVTPMGTVSGAGKSLSSILQIKLTRLTTDLNDTYAPEAVLVGLDLLYEVDSIGSTSEYVK